MGTTIIETWAPPVLSASKSPEGCRRAVSFGAPHLDGALALVAVHVLVIALALALVLIPVVILNRIRFNSSPSFYWFNGL